jgi:hypothetical protein
LVQNLPGQQMEVAKRPQEPDPFTQGRAEITHALVSLDLEHSATDFSDPHGNSPTIRVAAKVATLEREQLKGQSSRPGRVCNRRYLQGEKKPTVAVGISRP